jgi:hypothetical protein
MSGDEDVVAIMVEVLIVAAIMVEELIVPTTTGEEPVLLELEE